MFSCPGSIIRCMRRLEELLRQMCQAAKAIGNTELENKFAEGQCPVQAPLNGAGRLHSSRAATERPLVAAIPGSGVFQMICIYRCSLCTACVPGVVPSTRDTADTGRQTLPVELTGQHGGQVVSPQKERKERQDGWGMDGMVPAPRSGSLWALPV